MIAALFTAPALNAAAEAQRLRTEAETAQPARQAYLLWLADEWEKVAQPAKGLRRAS